MQAPREQLGSFYLGGEYDLAAKQVSETPLIYDARDLTTHAVCVGMTGSGKTGLCIGLLEEAALDKVPALLIDPKGDITNLLLQFPELRPQDFQPWVNVDDARRKEQTVEEYAAATAESWRKGLEGWGIGTERIAQLRESVDFTIYTPGSDAGVPISVLGSLAAPQIDFDENAELLRERISGTVAALLGLIGVKADPVRDREAVLLAKIFEHFWRKGEDLDLSKLILSIQKPPVQQLGVFDVETYYPEKDRFGLASALNSLVASPTFSAWLQGDPLNVDRLLYTPEGKPRHSIFYLAHLSDAERMFFVTLLLENAITWMRGQSGTTSLRALLYFDEVFGFFPPTAEPPSKRPLLTLMKQARAFGLGCILVTQNPVDVDYKGLANAGTWFIGKMQTERDRDRVLHGLQDAISNAGGEVQRTNFGELISRLDSRVFLMHNVHEEAPVVFNTRWAMSYLRGPLTRPQVRDLMDAGGKRKRPAAQAAAAATPAPNAAAPSAAPAVDAAASAVPAGYSATPSALAPDVPQVYMPVGKSDAAALRELGDKSGGRMTSVQAAQLVYAAGLIGAAQVSFVAPKRDIDHRVERVLALPVAEAGLGIDWADALVSNSSLRDLRRASESAAAAQGQGPFFGPVPEPINTARKIKAAEGKFSDYLYYQSRLPVLVHKGLAVVQKPDESERDFKIRLQQAAREARDEEVDALEERYETQIDKLTRRIEQEERDLADKKGERDARLQQEAISAGESVLNFFLGRRSSTIFSRAASKRRMTAKAKAAIDAQAEEIADLEQDKEELQADLKKEADEITRRWEDVLDEVTTEDLAPRRSDVEVTLVALGWLPYWRFEMDEGLGARSVLVEAYGMQSDEAAGGL